MTSDEFRLLALGLGNVRVVNQLGNINFMIGEKPFASLGAPDPAFAVLKLSPEQQVKALARSPSIFQRQPGGAGARGVTCVRLAMATTEVLAPFLKAAAAKAANAPSPRTVIGRR